MSLLYYIFFFFFFVLAFYSFGIFAQARGSVVLTFRKGSIFLTRRVLSSIRTAENTLDDGHPCDSETSGPHKAGGHNISQPLTSTHSVTPDGTLFEQNY
jgi:hypothetical protein